MRKHHRQHYSSRSGKKRLKQRRRSGWEMNLYRNTDCKKIAGVCAGLADHFEIAHWVMRLLFIAGFFFTGPLMVYLYIAAWLLLAPRKEEYAEESVEYDEHRREYRPKTMFRYSDDVSARVKDAQQRLKNTLQRIENVESYVTSRQYELNKEFSKLVD